MADAANNPPEVLRKQGLLRAVDNIGPEQHLAVPAAKLWTYFGAELRARFIRPRSQDGGGRSADE